MNQPAFPTKINTEHFSHPSTIYNTGMTLRDYFAAKAMHNFADQVSSQSDQEWFDKVAKGAYRMADTMLKAREA
jgi:hypothetical protein